MRKSFRVLSLLISSWVIPGTIGTVNGAESYYPLKEGMTWEYSLQSAKGGAKKLIIKNLAARQMDGITVIPNEWNADGNIIINFILENETGVYKIAEQKPGSKEPVKLKHPVCYIKYPILEGTTWENITVMGGRDLEISLTIYSLNDVVQVPAGTFKNCIKIKHEGKDISPDKDATSLSLEAMEWHAPGVGVVKSMATFKRKEKGKTSTEAITYQLESFKPAK